MTNKELITELLKYRNKHWIELKISDFDNSNTYLTDMNILHRLAVKVTDGITETIDNSDDLLWDLSKHKSNIISAMFTRPNEQGEHIQLATAIVNAIRYLSANKAQ